MLVYVWWVNIGCWWWLIGVLKGKCWYGVYYWCRWYLFVDSWCYCGRVFIFCLIIYWVILYVEVCWRLDYNRILRVKCFSNRNVYYRVGEVMVVGGWRCFYVYGKWCWGDVVYLVWYNNRNVGVYWFFFRWEVGYFLCDFFFVVFFVEKNRYWCVVNICYSFCYRFIFWLWDVC